MKELNGMYVTEELYAKARAVKNAGGKAWLCSADGKSINTCGNCKGTAALVFQFAVGSPAEFVPLCSGGSNPTTMTHIDGKWWAVKTHSYNCPVCHGGVDMNAKMTKNSAHQAVANLAYDKKMLREKSTRQREQEANTRRNDLLDQWLEG